MTEGGAGRATDPGRRLRPRFIDSDWLVMRDLSRAIQRVAAQIARPGSTAIDFGCGTMPYREIFAGLGCRYLGADFDGAPDIAIGADGALGVPDASADILLSFQVLEHVRDVGAYFSEARRVLRTDGRMLLSTHGTWLYHPHPEDHRRWTREGLAGEIENHGFELIDCVPIVGPLAWTTVLRLTCWSYALKKVPVLGAPAAWLTSIIMNARAIIEEAVTPAAIRRENACVYLTLSRPSHAPHFE